MITGYLTNLELWAAVLGLTGTMILFFFGLPPKVDPEGSTYLILEQGNQEEKRRYKIYKNVSYLGLLLIASSFLIQIIFIV